MLTIIIADKKFLEHAKEYYLFLQPFYDKATFEVCEWNPKAEDFNEMLPEIKEKIGRHSEWRAIIVSPSDDFDVQKKNPFDVVGIGQGLFSSYKIAGESPLTRLGVYLSTLKNDETLGTTEEKLKGLNAQIEDIQKKSEGDPANFSSLQIELNALVSQIEFYEEKLKQKEVISSFFDEFDTKKHLLNSLPAEIYFVSPRTFDNETYDFSLQSSGINEETYSAFAKRNMYPQSARFIAFDIREKEHAQYEYDFVCFLEFLFTFATNEIDRSTMLPEKLYRAVCDNDFGLLSDFLSRYEKKLSATKDFLSLKCAELLEDTGTLTDADVEATYCSEIPVPIVITKPIGDDQIKKKVTFGLFANVRNDINKVKNYDENVKRYIKKYKKSTVKAMEISCEYTRESFDEPISLPQKLTKQQENSIAEFSGESENKYTSIPPFESLDSVESAIEINDKQKAVEKLLRSRVSIKKFAFVLGSTALAFLLGFILFFTGRDNAAISALYSVMLFLVSLAIVCVSAFVIVYLIKRETDRAFFEYYNAVIRQIENFKLFSANYSELLSCVSEIVRSFSVFSYLRIGKSKRQSQVYVYKKHIQDILEAHETAAEIFGKFKIRETNAFLMSDSAPYDYDFLKTQTYVYPLPLSEADIKKINFMGSDFSGEIPIGFIREINVIREEIIDA